jgi:hypothetical protein
MAASNRDLRRFPRVHVDVEAKVSTADGRQLVARTRDLSRSGICVITTDSVASGETLLIELVLLLGPGSSSEPLPLHARVVWCTAIAKSFQVGAMFDGLSTKQASFLDMFLRYLDGSILPAGAEMEVLGYDEQESTDESGEDGQALPSPDDTDDPFRP